MSIFLRLTVALALLATVAQAGARTLSFYGTPLNPIIKEGEGEGEWVAQASYSPASEHVSNFAQLTVSTSKLFQDDLQTFAAGYLEGLLTAESVHQHYDNMVCQVDCSGYVSPQLRDFFETQDAWARAQVSANAECPYWGHIGSLLAQADGLRAGYGASEEAVKRPLDAWAFTLINSLGDLFDIVPAVDSTQRPDFKSYSYPQLQSHMQRTGHCSALIKVTAGLEEVWVGHTSWFTYSAMLRIYKSYKFDLQNPSSQADKQLFSSYPGTLSSLDDMYMMAGSELLMTQTTNNIFNASLWDLVVPQSLLAWQRVRTANQLASSGPEWFDVVKLHNSGTYNNQYMILDLKKWAPQQAMPRNTLFVVEQIPGLVLGTDVTDVLERGYWGSYNVPFHKQIYLESGYEVVDIAAGNIVGSEYQQAPRSKIFRRDAGAAVDLESMQQLMRYNQFQTDVYAEGDAWGAIAARGDLNKAPYAGGGYDTKVTSGGMFVKSQVSVVNGPTSQDQAPFRWSTSGLNDSHVGQPDVFDFQFELISL